MPEGILRYLMFGDAVAIQCGLALMAGGLASMLWLRQCASSWARDVVRTSRRSAFIGAGVAWVASVAALWFQAAAMGDGALGSAGSMVPMMVRETHYGHAWSAGFAALTAAAIGMAASRRFFVPVGALGLAAFMLTRSVVSHAGGDGDFTLKVLVDWVHLVLVCLWVGMVFLGAFIALRRAPNEQVDAADSAVWVSSLSETATVALVGILSTGALKIWWATPSIAQLVASSYGGVLVVKLLLVGAAIALGGVNRFFVMPPLLARPQGTARTAPNPQLRFVHVLRMEALVLLLVFVAAAILSGTPNPGEG
jgi:putative copper resistance protein D